MYLTDTENDRLLVFMAAELARRTRDDGQLLNAPEAVALICDEMHRAARRGATRGEVLNAGRAAVRLNDVMEGVPGVVREIRLEVLMDDGKRLVVLGEPWRGDE